MSKFAERKFATLAVLLAVIGLIGGIYIRKDLKIGDLDPGAPELRADSRYEYGLDSLTDSTYTRTFPVPVTEALLGVAAIEPAERVLDVACGSGATALIAAHPSDPRGYNDLGILLARAGRTAEAREVFARGLAAIPENEQPRRNLDLLVP